MAKKKSSLGCLFYTALVLLVIVLFLFQWNKVREVVESTGFLKMLQKGGDTPALPAPAQPAAPPAAAPIPPSAAPAPSPQPAAPKSIPQTTSPLAPTGAQAAEAKSPPAARPAPAGAAPATAVPARNPPSRPAAGAATGTTAAKAGIRTRKARIYFVAVDTGGGTTLKEVTRTVEYTDAPLTSTLHVLLKGPTSAEGKAGLLTAIPAESRLIQVTVRDGIAFLDFSESFRFNALGEEGLQAQLKQIVWSATEFPNLSRVQFLIDGKKVKYLGPEGTYIGEPLSRQSFR